MMIDCDETYVEYWATFDANPCDTDSTKVGVTKTGGGTIGRSYEGSWEYHVVDNGEHVFCGDNLYTGMPKTHSEVATLVCDFLKEEE